MHWTIYSNRFCDLSLGAVNASRGVVMTREPNGELKTRAMRGERFRISATVRDLVTKERKSLLVRDARLEQDFASRTSILAQEVRSILAVPLQTDEGVIGLLYLDSPRPIREFTIDDLNLVTVMANIAAIRIENARLEEQEESRKLLFRELDRAAEIQKRLLPSHAPLISGLDLAGYNAPCWTVGGDYYDFLRYPDGRVALVIGDVSGKGLGAALLMSSLQARVQVFFENAENLGEQLSRLNRSLTAHSPGNCFITFAAAVLDTTTGELAYCNAGHNPPMLLHRNDEVEMLEPSGIPLGISRDAPYEQKICRLEQEDILTLFSDGVTEACGTTDVDREFGEERLLAVVKRKRELPAASLIDAINAEIRSFTSGAPALDDITLVVARRC